MANHFVDDVVSFALKLCKHRNGTALEPADVLLALSNI
jgi:transcription initiation factor TFIID subunit TAF12